MDQFVDHLFADRLGRSEALLSDIDAIAILAELVRDTSPHLGGTLSRRIDHFFPTGSRLLHALEEMRLEQVAERPAAPETSGNGLVHLYQQFYDRVQREGYSTRGSRYADVARGISGIRFEDISTLVLAGFFSFTRSEQCVARRLDSLDNTVFLYQAGPGLCESVAGLHSTFPPVGGGQTRPVPVLHRSPDIHGEVLALSSQLADLRRRGETLDETTVIVLPSADALFPVREWVLPLLEDGDFNVSLPYPLARTPVVGFLRDLFHVIGSMDGDRIYAPAYRGFTLHPYIKNILWKGDAEPTRILFHEIEKYQAKSKARTFFRLADLEDDLWLWGHVADLVARTGVMVTPDEVREHVEGIHRRTLVPLLDAETVGEFAAGVMEVVQYVADASTARFHPLFREFVLATLRSLNELVDSRLQGRTLPDRMAYAALVQRVLEGGSVPFAGTPVRGLQILGLLETRNLQFTRVFLLDVNDDLIPGPDEIDPILPPAVRQTLGLPDRSLQQRIARYHYDLLVGAASDIHLFYREGGGRARSRFLEEEIWRREREQGKLDDGAMTEGLQYRLSVATTVPPPLTKTPQVLGRLKTMRYNVSALDTYLSCPLRFLYRSVLRLGEAEEVTGELEASDVGKIVHAILADLLRPALGVPLTADSLDPRRVGEIAESHIRSAFGTGLLGERFLIRAQLLRRVQEVVEQYLLPLCTEHAITVMGVEQDIVCTRHGFTLTGRMDRIDRRSGRTMILDYKTGREAGGLTVRMDRLAMDDRSTWRSAVGSLQLPLYALLLCATEGVPVTGVDCAYVFLGEGRVTTDIEVDAFRDTLVPEERMEKLDGLLQRILREVNDPEIPFTATEDLEGECPRCIFQTICGTEWTGRRL
jgi:RecB family exonuclease